MLVAHRELKLAPHGTFRAGQPVPEKVWNQLRERTRQVLLDGKRVVVHAQPRPSRKKA